MATARLMRISQSCPREKEREKERKRPTERVSFHKRKRKREREGGLQSSRAREGERERERERDRSAYKRQRERKRQRGRSQEAPLEHMNESCDLCMGVCTIVCVFVCVFVLCARERKRSKFARDSGRAGNLHEKMCTKRSSGEAVQGVKKKKGQHESERRAQ